MVLPDDLIPLQGATVTVRPGGVNVRAAPDLESPRLGGLREGESTPVVGLAFGDYTWLQVPWGDGTGWIAGEYTDFARSTAYDQAAAAWYDSDAVLNVRRDLARTLLRAARGGADQLAQVDTLRGEALIRLEDALSRRTLPPQVAVFWDLADRLGLPAPFEFLPVHPAPPDRLAVHGFGPTTFAWRYSTILYAGTRGLHVGLDYFVPEGSPLIAVSDGLIVEAAPAETGAEPSLALRPFLPDGSGDLSNVVIVYGHLTGDPTVHLVHPGDEVRAGEIIGTSGWPVFRLDDGTTGIQHNNAHLHLEAHFVTDGYGSLNQRVPFNPLLLWSPRLVAWQARLASGGESAPYPVEGHPFGRLGLFSLGAVDIGSRSNVWDADAPWPEGVYTLDGLLGWLDSFAPYAP
ncbi:MAG: peptidoglycan DD-metalloendopeptidase family protein [Anaerolineae bacterium]|nr:peptidoglycan DD-metalloendopeptidase family protein [Anaerolineae bacterium]